MKKGILIVIDGADGCGKETQSNQLIERLERYGRQVAKTDFPRYYNNFFGKLIGVCQNDPLMEFSKVDPKLASILYAADRFESSSQIKGWLADGRVVVSDRYVSANQLHQGGKIKDEEERKLFLEYLDRMEYEFFEIPRPDLTIYLDVPHPISLKLMAEKSASNKKAYSGHGMDMVEKDAEYQLNARESGLKMLADPTWRRIECSNDGVTLLPREVIGDMVFEECKKIL